MNYHNLFLKKIFKEIQKQLEEQGKTEKKWRNFIMKI